MEKLFGIILIVAAIWVGAKVYTEGTRDAFGGVFAFLSSEETEPAPDEPRPWVGDKFKRAAENAYQAGIDRVERQTRE